jgi:hypothetical protein
MNTNYKAGSNMIETGIRLKKSNPELANNRLLNDNLEYLAAVEGIKDQLSAIALKHYNATCRIGKEPIVGRGYIDGATTVCLSALHDDKEHPGYYLIAINEEGDVSLASCDAMIDDGP